MRLLALLLLAACCAPVLAGDNPRYSCDAKAGCVVETGSTHDIGNGTLLTLPEGWMVLAYPQPPISDLKLREIRAQKGDVVIAITPFPNIDHRVITEAWTRDILSKSSGQYVAQSRERAVTIDSLSRDDLVGDSSSFTSEPSSDKPFRVLPNRRFASVTTLIFAWKSVIFSVSVASESAPDDDYRAALDAFRHLK